MAAVWRRGDGASIAIRIHGADDPSLRESFADYHVREFSAALPDAEVLTSDLAIGKETHALALAEYGGVEGVWRIAACGFQDGRSRVSLISKEAAGSRTKLEKWGKRTCRIVLGGFQHWHVRSRELWEAERKR